MSEATKHTITESLFVVVVLCCVAFGVGVLSSSQVSLLGVLVSRHIFQEEGLALLVGGFFVFEGSGLLSFFAGHTRSVLPKKEGKETRSTRMQHHVRSPSASSWLDLS